MPAGKRNAVESITNAIRQYAIANDSFRAGWSRATRSEMLPQIAMPAALVSTKIAATSAAFAIGMS